MPGDPVRLGNASLQSARRADGGAGPRGRPTMLGARALIALAALPATGLVAPGSHAATTSCASPCRPGSPLTATMAHRARPSPTRAGASAGRATPPRASSRFVEQTGLFLTLVGLTRPAGRRHRRRHRRARLARGARAHHRHPALPGRARARSCSRSTCCRSWPWPRSASRSAWSPAPRLPSVLAGCSAGALPVPPRARPVPGAAAPGRGVRAADRGRLRAVAARPRARTSRARRCSATRCCPHARGRAPP